MSRPLPVVAIGSIPYIYQRVSFSLWATPTGALPRRWLRDADRVNPTQWGIRSTLFDMAWSKPIPYVQQKLSNFNNPSRSNCLHRMRWL